MSKKTRRYFEPNAAPEEVLNQSGKRRVTIRFMTEQDAKDFVAKTGISLHYGKVNHVEFPLTTNLSSFFN